MFALTPGELAIVLFLFALIWGAGLLPRLGARLGTHFHKRTQPGRDAQRVRPADVATDSHSPRDGG
ncbi:MAG: hypothetical protein M3O46_15425 [Myxococcota bacterium]|nr:hypothetical protein [Myxococcota bacterium]